MGSSASRDSRVDPRIDVVVLDVDGTLVDSVYQHTVAWADAFRGVGNACVGQVSRQAVQVPQ